MDGKGNDAKILRKSSSEMKDYPGTFLLLKNNFYIKVCNLFELSFKSVVQKLIYERMYMCTEKSMSFLR